MLAESEENSVGHSCENSAEIMVEMYLKEPVLSHRAHSSFDPLEREKATVSMSGLSSLQISFHSSLFSCI